EFTTRDGGSRGKVFHGTVTTVFEGRTTSMELSCGSASVDAGLAVSISFLYHCGRASRQIAWRQSKIWSRIGSKYVRRSSGSLGWLSRGKWIWEHTSPTPRQNRRSSDLRHGLASLTHC